MIRIAPLALTALLPTIALADDGAVVTQPSTGSPPIAEAPPALPTERAARGAEPGQTRRCGGDGRPHGQATVGIGTGGYREASGTVVAPVGECGYVALSIGTVRSDGARAEPHGPGRR